MEKLTKENACFICQHVFDKVRPVCHVAHVSRGGGDWQMLCGEADDFTGNNGPRLVHIGHLLARDPSLRELHDLPINWRAIRDQEGGAWRRYPIKE